MSSNIMVKKVVNQEDKEYLDHLCGECANQEEVWKFNTLTVKDGKPTLGKYPFIDGRCILLSEKACFRFKKRKI